MDKSKRALEIAVNLLGGQSAVARMLRRSGVPSLADCTQQSVYYWIHSRYPMPVEAVNPIIEILHQQAELARAIDRADLRPDKFSRALDDGAIPPKWIGTPG